MIDLGDFIQYDLANAEDCMDLVSEHAWTNTQLKDLLAKGNRYLTVPKK